MRIRFNFKLEGDEILSQNVPTVESDVGLVQDLRRIVRTSFIMYHWVYALCTSTEAKSSSWFQCIIMLVVWAFLLCFGAIPPMLCFFVHVTTPYKRAGTSTEKCSRPERIEEHEHQQQRILHPHNSELLFRLQKQWNKAFLVSIESWTIATMCSCSISNGYKEDVRVFFLETRVRIRQKGWCVRLYVRISVLRTIIRFTTTL